MDIFLIFVNSDVNIPQSDENNLYKRILAFEKCVFSKFASCLEVNKLIENITKKKKKKILLSMYKISQLPTPCWEFSREI